MRSPRKKIAHCPPEPPLSFAISNHLAIILPLPAGEGWGEGESFERECRTVHGEGESHEWVRDANSSTCRPRALARRFPTQPHQSTNPTSLPPCHTFI